MFTQRTPTFGTDVETVKSCLTNGTSLSSTGSLEPTLP